MHGRGIKPRQPHIPDDSNFQWVLRVFQSFTQTFSSGLVTDVGLKFKGVRGRPSHNDLDDPLGVVFVMPFRSNLYNLIIQLNTNPPTHADNHGFTLEYRVSGLEVLNHILSDERQPSFVTHNGLQPCPFGFESLTVGNLFTFG